MEIRRVDYSKKETIGALLPTISFGGTYNRMLAKQVMYMNMDKMGLLVTVSVTVVTLPIMAILRRMEGVQPQVKALTV